MKLFIISFFIYSNINALTCNKYVEKFLVNYQGDATVLDLTESQGQVTAALALLFPHTFVTLESSNQVYNTFENLHLINPIFLNKKASIEFLTYLVGCEQFDVILIGDLSFKDDWKNFIDIYVKLGEFLIFYLHDKL